MKKKVISYIASTLSVAALLTGCTGAFGRNLSITIEMVGVGISKLFKT